MTKKMFGNFADLNEIERAAFHGLALLILIFFISAPVARAQNKTPPQKAREKPLPNLILETIDGKKWSLYENRGRVVVLNFWATWCEPCRVETPMLVKLADEYEENGLRVVGIALDDPERLETVKNFIAEYEIDYPVLLPVPFSQLARIDPVPTTLLIDARGRLAKKYVGLIPEEILRKEIEKLLKK